MEKYIHNHIQQLYEADNSGYIITPNRLGDGQYWCHAPTRSQIPSPPVVYLLVRSIEMKRQRQHYRSRIQCEKSHPLEGIPKCRRISIGCIEFHGIGHPSNDTEHQQHQQHAGIAVILGSFECLQFVGGRLFEMVAILQIPLSECNRRGQHDEGSREEDSWKRKHLMQGGTVHSIVSEPVISDQQHDANVRQHIAAHCDGIETAPCFPACPCNVSVVVEFLKDPRDLDLSTNRHEKRADHGDDTRGEHHGKDVAFAFVVANASGDCGSLWGFSVLISGDEEGYLEQQWGENADGHERVMQTVMSDEMVSDCSLDDRCLIFVNLVIGIG
mmetsp:Transcript_22079/g.35419  ORF Transcript_22079/g.35419 Transcript_22079/m.35419 type:complete len:328 (-) Transcript_22079:108-1091(-)